MKPAMLVTIERLQPIVRPVGSSVWAVSRSAGSKASVIEPAWVQTGLP